MARERLGFVDLDRPRLDEIEALRTTHDLSLSEDGLTEMNSV